MGKTLQRLFGAHVEKALTFLDDRLLPATSNAVERANRRHRKMQKTIYRVRTLAHIAERMFSIYLPVSTAGHVHFCPQPAELVRMLGVVRPTSFFGVPRVWEKVRAGIQSLLTME